MVKTIQEYWFCPLYSFKCDTKSINFTYGIEIKRIFAEFHDYLASQRSIFNKTEPSEANWIVIFPQQRKIIGNTKEEKLREAFKEQDNASQLLVNFITALKLCHKGRVIAGPLISASNVNSEWSFGGTTIHSQVSETKFFIEESEFILKQSEVTKINKILNDLINAQVADKLKYLYIVLDRFHSSYHGNIEDRLIDQIIALEAIYLKDPQELNYKLGMRTAFLIGRNGNDKKLIFKTIKNAYTARSKIVHGGEPPKRSELRKITSEVDQYIRRSILKYLIMLKNKSLKDIKDSLDTLILH